MAGLQGKGQWKSPLFNIFVGQSHLAQSPKFKCPSANQRKLGPKLEGMGRLAEKLLEEEQAEYSQTLLHLDPLWH